MRYFARNNLSGGEGGGGVSFWLDVASSPQVKIFVLSREVKILLLSLNKLG